MSLDATARAVLACVCAAFVEAEKPLCSCRATIGQPVVGLCCECEPGVTGSAIMQVEEVFSVDQDLNRVQRIVTCKKGPRAVDLTILVSRCWPTIDESGDLDDDDIDAAASEVHDDMDIMWKAFSCCSERLVIRRVAVDANPTAGCSMIVGQVTVALP